MLRNNSITAHMLEHARELLTPVDALSKSGRLFPFRSRFAHCGRVTEWALRLSETEGGDIGVLAVSTIFHDVGYQYEGDGHARHSADLFRSYSKRYLIAGNKKTTPCGGGIGAQSVASGHGESAGAGNAYAQTETYEKTINTHRFNTDELSKAIRAAVSSPDSLEKIYNMILTHSDKHLPIHSLPLESNILMDADILDEAGALAVLFDCFVETESPGYDYQSAFLQIKGRFDKESGIVDQFRTGEGQRRYMEMRGYVGGFINGLGYELGGTP